LEGPLHRFQAESDPVYDHCLPSTISELRKLFGLSFHVRTVRLPGYAGRGAYVAEYTLADESVARAQELAKREDKEGAA
jgi:hypothetical protein